LFQFWLLKHCCSSFPYCSSPSPSVLFPSCPGKEKERFIYFFPNVFFICSEYFLKESINKSFSSWLQTDYKDSRKMLRMSRNCKASIFILIVFYTKLRTAF
jgi:hypothetical protein